ncbi:helix-turn-helix domain-containing protein [Streptomyces cavernae]|uniref:helix-turn-helix domain-containing protein n=1 Tax=Streptomyces cavernae TaxID=2259034 RepID=UPI000FEBB90F|nr:helix-turn-helix domain-containing protein [Streptomyces cavernae]
MSAAHIGLVFEAKDLDGSEKLLLLALTNYTYIYGYCWPSEGRLAADCGTSRSTVQRVKRKLAARGLVKSVRRVNPRTGEPISNLTRVNLPLLAAMRQEPRQYQDNLFEAITFDDDSQGDPAGSLAGTPDSPEPFDLLIRQNDAYPESNWSRPRRNVTPTQPQDDAQSLIDPVVIPSPLPPSGTAQAAASPGVGGGGKATQRNDHSRGAVFVDALPYAGRMPSRKQRAELIERAEAAFAAGWLEVSLHQQLTTETGNAKSLAAVYLHRLDRDNLPAAPMYVPTPSRARVAPWQTCDGCDRAFRAPEPGLCRDCRSPTPS